MLLNNRHGSVDSDVYRYGFQGQERDDEVKGEGNSYNYTFRMHDPRLGRFFAVDPLSPKYPHYTPYQFSGNRTLDAVELEGLEEFRMITKKDWVARFYKVQPGDNLSVISKITGVAVEDIISYNPSIQNNPDLIFVDQTLTLRNIEGLDWNDFIIPERSSWAERFIVEMVSGDLAIQRQMEVVLDPLGVAVETAFGVNIPPEVDALIAVYSISRGRAKARKRAARRASRAGAKTVVRDKILYRGERSSVKPEDVFKDGLSSKGTHDNLLEHVSSNGTAGDFISTSSSKSIATSFGGKNGYVYVIRSENAIDVNSALGSRSPFPEQLEFSIPGNVRADNVLGAYKLKNGNITGDFIPNPNLVNDKP